MLNVDRKMSCHKPGLNGQKLLYLLHCCFLQGFSKLLIYISAYCISTSVFKITVSFSALNCTLVSLYESKVLCKGLNDACLALDEK